MYTDFKEEHSVYKPTQADLTFPKAKSFSNFKDLRNELKRKLVVACRAFSYFKFDYGFAGHLTVRDPEFKDLYWTNPMAVHFKQVKLSNLILVDHDGKVVEGDYSVNQAGFVLHAAVHKEHPEIVAMCHAHTLYGAAFASFGKKLDPISQDACAFYEDHNVITEEAGAVAVSVDAGMNLAKSFKDVKAVIHQNHGLLTMSKHSIDSAAFWFSALERCCQQELLVMSAGQAPNLVPHDRAVYSKENVGSDYIGWLHFQPIHDHLVATEKDMFD